MEKVKKAKKLQQDFFRYVAISFILVAILSGGTILSCFSIRNWLLPTSNEVFLNVERVLSNGEISTSSTRMKIGENAHEIPSFFILEDGEKIYPTEEAKYSITSIENNFTMLSPKRKLLYHTCGIIMIAFPLLFSLLGILCCGLQFYKRKLQIPIDILSAATEKIAKQDLDFVVEISSEDELGELCCSFEQMRKMLSDNNKKMWAMLEERRQLQASVAHDLRNPIAIIECYIQYLQMYLSDGKITEEELFSIIDKIERAAKRLERYTSSMGTIHHIEELEIERKEVNFIELIQDIKEDLSRITEQNSIELHMESKVEKAFLNLDPQVLCRILENLINNAVRYAKSRICISFEYENNYLHVCVMDDGPGFSKKILQARNTQFISDSKESEHSGIGLTICRILSSKHGGNLTVNNTENGNALVRFSLFT